MCTFSRDTRTYMEVDEHSILKFIINIVIHKIGKTKIMNNKRAFN